MEPSCREAQTPEEVQLAYAQQPLPLSLSSPDQAMKGFGRYEADGHLSRERCKRVDQGCPGLTFEEFETHWKEFLGGKGIQGSRRVRTCVATDKGRENGRRRLEMEEIKSLVQEIEPIWRSIKREGKRKGLAVSEYRRALAGCTGFCAHYDKALLCAQGPRSKWARPGYFERAGYSLPIIHDLPRLVRSIEGR